MFINRQHYDALLQAHWGETEALKKTIAAKDFAIEQLQKEIANLEARIEYNKQRAAKRLEATAEAKKPRKPYHKPVIKAEDNREELRNDNRDDDNHYHKMPEE